MKNTKKIVSILLVLGIISGCNLNDKPVANNVNKPIISANEQFCTDECRPSDMSVYSIKSNQFRDATFQDLELWLGDADFSGIVYLGFEECPWCQAAVPVLNAVLEEEQVQAYYINKKNEVDGNSQKYLDAVTSLLNEEYELDKDNENKPHIYYPTVLAIKHGKVVGHNVGTVESHIAYERSMTEEESIQLYNMYHQFIDSLSE